MWKNKDFQQDRKIWEGEKVEVRPATSLVSVRVHLGTQSYRDRRSELL